MKIEEAREPCNVVIYDVPFVLVAVTETRREDVNM